MSDQVRQLPHRALAAVVILAAALALAGYAIVAAHRSGCAARNTSLDVMNNIIMAAQQQTDSDRTVPPAKKAASDLFVAQALAKIEAARCG